MPNLSELRLLSKTMKRILIVSTLAIATLVGFSSVASSADTGVSTHSGTAPKTCAVTATNGTLAPVANNIVAVGGNFPKVLSSATADGGTPGKFTTLCNSERGVISISVGTVIVPAGQTGETTTFKLSATGGVYPAGFLLPEYDSSATVGTNQVRHAYSETPTDLNVSAKITADTGKVLVGSTAANSYSVPITATLTPF
jgi:hypothetical protein